MFNTFSAVHKTERLNVIFCAVTRQTPSLPHPASARVGTGDPPAAVAHHRRLGFAALSIAPLTFSIAEDHELTIYRYVTAYNARGDR
jgi:hypothetical protein